MPGAFQYRPKFVDIRVRPPSDNDEAAEDVHALKPGERRCDHPGCLRPATARAPKARDMLHEHYWFCQPHAAEYNRNWNFFAGLPEAEVRRLVYVRPGVVVTDDRIVSPDPRLHCPLRK